MPTIDKQTGTKINQLNAKQEWLVHLLDMESKGFAGQTSSRRYPKRVAQALVGDGLAKNELLQMCDGDGFALDPERYRWGYVLTDTGRSIAQQVDEVKS